MHPVTIRIHHWYVPNRILWSDWEDFITGGPNNDYSGTPPQINVAGSTADTCLDYMGIPHTFRGNLNALPIRAYNKIYNEFYRDQDLQSESAEDSNALRNCAWEKDYFSQARPWQQKGPEISLPLGTKAPVSGIATQFDATFPTADIGVKETGKTGNQVYAKAVLSTGVDPEIIAIQEDPNNPGRPNIYADLSDAGALPINELRRAFALQRYAEARARYGSRYTEYLQALGITAADQRLQRPEYLGGGKQTISFSEILSTVDQTADAQQPLGTMGGHGIAGMRSRKYRRFFQEHGYVITMMSVRPKAIYMDATERHWYHQDKTDYYQKELMQIGQQPIYNKEVKANHATPDGVFGYADRYSNYKSMRSMVTGEFRNPTLNFWHMARDLSGADPALNESFIKCNPTKRIHAVQTNHVLWCMINHKISARRLVSKSSASRIL